MMHKWKIIVASSSEAFDLSKRERRVKPGAPLSIGDDSLLQDPAWNDSHRALCD